MGDGTTSVAVLCGELLREAEHLLAQRIHPQTVAQGAYVRRMGCGLCVRGLGGEGVMCLPSVRPSDRPVDVG